MILTHEHYVTSFRGNEIQMHEYCQTITGSPLFAFQGSDFSYGDRFIEKCARAFFIKVEPVQSGTSPIPVGF